MKTNYVGEFTNGKEIAELVIQTWLDNGVFNGFGTLDGPQSFVMFDDETFPQAKNFEDFVNVAKKEMIEDLEKTIGGNWKEK